ncbi:P-loop NTPase, partial [Candidatus Bathyarchaeota archaeon]|nr:P-loop NTPase [Candidatus Bathyarchaeota archaeon]
VAYSGDSALPLRGADVSNALIELFAVTRWGELDFLIIDMPPGISDATLDIIRFVRRIEFLIVTTSSVLAFETVRKLVGLLSDLRVPVIGVIENMKFRENSVIGRLAAELGLRFLGAVPFDAGVEDALGDVERLLGTVFARRLEELVSKSDFWRLKRKGG